MQGFRACPVRIFISMVVRPSVICVSLDPTSQRVGIIGDEAIKNVSGGTLGTADDNGDRVDMLRLDGRATSPCA